MTVRRRLLRLLWAGPVALGVCYFALWACAPILTSPSPAPIPDGNTNQLGVGVTGAAEIVPGTCYAGLFGDMSCSGFDFKAFYRHKFKAPVELDVSAHGGFTTLAGAGLRVRGYFAETDVFRAGLSGGVGWAYASLGVPFAGKIGPNVWLYTEPTGTLASVGAARLPVGLSFTAGQTSIDLEVGAATAADFVPYPYGGLGLGFSF